MDEIPEFFIPKFVKISTNLGMKNQAGCIRGVMNVGRGEEEKDGRKRKMGGRRKARAVTVVI